jgi:ABC-type phosphate/phosphonate transport system, permease component
MVRARKRFLGVGLFCLYFSDVSITTHDPWLEINRMIVGVFTPDFLAISAIGDALLKTVSFAIIGVSIGAVAGFLLAQIFHLRVVRFVCSFVRSIHELFWALIFLQMLGLTPKTSLLAIAVPYAGICAKVYSETLDESHTHALQAVPYGSGIISIFFYVRLPEVWTYIVSYTQLSFRVWITFLARCFGFIWTTDL